MKNEQADIVLGLVVLVLIADLAFNGTVETSVSGLLLLSAAFFVRVILERGYNGKSFWSGSIVFLAISASLLVNVIIRKDIGTVLFGLVIIFMGLVAQLGARHLYK